jgi:hypothetical protein
MSEETFPPEDVPHNFRMGALNGLTYLLAETLFDPSLVIVAFLSHLTRSPLLLGLVLPIRDGAWFLPQLWISGYLQNVPHKLTFYRNMSYIRIVAWIVIALTVNLVAEPNLLLILFFITFTISSFSNGLAGLPWVEVVAKTIPPQRRGEYFAWRMGLGGLASIGGAAVVRWVLDPASPLPFPHNFGLLNIAFLVLGTLSVVFFTRVREPVSISVLPRQSFSHQVRRAGKALKTDRRYRLFIGLQSTLFMAGTAIPFFAVFVQQELGGSTSMIGVYLAVLTLTNLSANILFGRLSRRRGNTWVMMSAIACGLAMMALVTFLAVAAEPLQLSGTVADAWLVPVFILSGLRGSAMGVYGNSLMLEIAPVSERSLYVGATNTFLGIVMLVTGISGVIVGLLGFEALFLFALLAHGWPF